MKDQSFQTSFTVKESPEEVFNAIANVRGWWSQEVEGGTSQVNDEFYYHYQDVHTCRMKLVEVKPNEKMVWRVLDNYFNFTRDTTEWKDTLVIFEIKRTGNDTQLVFTHEGLTPQYECYAICFDAWTNYIHESLFKLITTGKGKPNTAQGNEFQKTITERL